MSGWRGVLLVVFKSDHVVVPVFNDIDGIIKESTTQEDSIPLKESNSIPLEH